MQHNLPDGVGARERMFGRILGRDSLEHLANRRAVPGFTIMGSEYLVLNSFALGHSPSTGYALVEALRRRLHLTAVGSKRQLGQVPDSGGAMIEAPDTSQFPRALPAPDGTSVRIDSPLIQQAIEGSRKSPRKRVILPLHQSPSETLHRMLNAVQPGSYIRPHRHLHPPKAEAIVLLRGALRYFEFTTDGTIADSIIVSAAIGNIGLDTRPGVFHTFVATEPDTVVFEAKPGPYEPTTDKDFASWAPAEGSPAVAEYLDHLQHYHRQ